MGSDVLAETMTDDQGKFEYEGQFLNQTDATYVTAHSSHHLYGRKSSGEYPIQSGNEINVELHYETSPNLKGFVKDEDGDPVANARIRLRSPDNTRSTVSPWHHLAKTNEDGEYGFTLEPATYYYFIKADDYTLDGATDAIVIKEGQTHMKNFVMKEGDQKQYLITTLDSNRSPLANVAIYASVPNKGRGNSQVGTTGNNGKYEFDLYKYFSPMEGMIPMIKAVPPHDMDFEEKSVTLEDGQKEVVMILEESKKSLTSLRGRVVDQQKNPIQEYSLMLIPSQKIDHYKLSESIYNTWIPIRSSDGSFTIDHVSADIQSYMLVARKDQHFAMSDLVEVQKQEVVNDILIVMESPMEVTGKVVNAETKEPVQGMAIYPQFIFDFVQQNQQGRNQRLHRRGLNFGNQTNLVLSIEKGITNEQGNFRMANMPRKPMNLFFEKEQYGHRFISISPKEASLNVGTIEVEKTGQWRRRMRR